MRTPITAFVFLLKTVQNEILLAGFIIVGGNTNNGKQNEIRENVGVCAFQNEIQR